MIERAQGILETAKGKMADAVKFLEEDMKTYRVGKANPLVFNNVHIDYYGTPTPLPQASSITTPDAKTIIIQPWDKSLIHAIEKAILDANIGFTPQNNGEQIRCTVPAMTEEHRREVTKKVKTAGENAKIVVRNARREAIEALKKAQKEGLSEDLEKDFEQDVQKETDAFGKKIDELCNAKEKEILTV